MTRFTALAILAVLCVQALELGANEPISIDWKQHPDVFEKPVALTDAKCVVVCFLGSECPLAQLYGSRLNSLAKQFDSQGVRFVGVNSNYQDSLDDVRKYARQHGLQFPIIKDADQWVARTFQATRTPEVFVLDGASRVRYQGRIDDQYLPGLARNKPTKNDLLEAIEKVVAGESFPVLRTEAVGCLITFMDPQSRVTDTNSIVTFSRDVAPILNRHCVECHRPGEIGPFALTEYEEVKGWSAMMLEVIDEGRMPPWHADPRHGKFVGARRMEVNEQKTLAAWVQQGMPQGDPGELPPPPKKSDGWHLATAPDEVVSMRGRPFVVPADGIVEYQYFVIDPKWKEDRWIRAAQVIPGDASVVHHSIVFVRPPDGAATQGIGWMGAYVPGQRAAALPPGHARRIPAGSKLVFQMHYTPNGKATEDVTRVGVWLSESKDVTHEVVTRLAIDQDFEIPPGADSHKVKLRMSGFARNARLLSATPHMHLRGKSFRLDARREGETETLLNVPRYDFNWQHWYRFQEPLALDSINSLEMTVRFDNSSDNPANPAPNEYVTWGDQTGEEMAVAFFDVAYPRGQPRIIVRDKRESTPEDDAVRARKIEATVNKFLAAMDGDKDGVVTKDEAPLSFRRFAFRRFDQNRDGKIDRAELELAAAERL